MRQITGKGLFSFYKASAFSYKKRTINLKDKHLQIYKYFFRTPLIDNFINR